MRSHLTPGRRLLVGAVALAAVGTVLGPIAALTALSAYLLGWFRSERDVTDLQTIIIGKDQSLMNARRDLRAAKEEAARASLERDHYRDQSNQRGRVLERRLQAVPRLADLDAAHAEYRRNLDGPR